MARAIVTVVAIIQSGIASQYAPNVMERVIANRQAGLTWHGLPAELPQASGYIAVVDCHHIGEIWFVRPEGGKWEQMLVADCAGPQLRADGLTGAEWMRRNNVVIEIGFPTARRWNVVGRGVRVEVIKNLDLSIIE